MRHLTLTEGAPPQPLDLSPAEAEVLEATELAVITRSPGSDQWLVSAGKKVGVVGVGELQVNVRPKIPVDRLIFLMGYAADPSFWRNHNVQLDIESDLPEALAHAFTRLASKALEQGLLQGYRVVNDSLPVLRGRIRVRDQISHRYGRGLPLEITYDDFTVDIAENQILLAAVSRLGRVPGLTAPVRRQLHRLRLQLVGVTDLERGRPLPEWQESRLNARYHSPLHLAELILGGDSFEQRLGDLQVSGFAFDMWRIYEDFICVSLREELAPHGAASLQHRMYFDQAGQVVMQPDFVWTGSDGNRVVADAKYKAERPAGFPQADLYQLLAYCTVLNLSEGHLIYAQGNETDVVHAVRGSGVSIHCHTIDLDQAPDELLHQISVLGGVLAPHRTPIDPTQFGSGQRS